MTKWFRHDIEAHNDLKIRKIMKRNGVCAYGAFWVVVELIYQNGGILDESIIREELDLLDGLDYVEILKKSGLFIIEGDKWTSERIKAEIEAGEQNIERFRMMGKRSAERRLNIGSTQAELTLNDNSTHAELTLNDNSTHAEHNKQLHIQINKEGSVNTLPKKVGWEKPTLSQIQSYCTERKNNVDPEEFYDFYESKGWMIGKNRMKDWKAAVRTWEKGKTSSKTDRNDFYGGKYIKGTDIKMDITAKGEDRSQYDPNVRLEDIL